MSDADSWLEYSNKLNSKEGCIEKIISFLSNNEALLEISTIKMKDKFPVTTIITLINNEDFLTGKNLNEKISGLQKIFEILFGYSKNLLLKFDIYRDKYIKIDTFQIVNSLSKLPNYTHYLSLIGYDFHENSQEWRYSEKTLSNKRREKLHYLTVCCAVGYDYWNDCLKYLSLTIFSDHRLSMENLMNEKKCEFCDFELDKSKYRCTVCLTEIKKMAFFEIWQSQPIVAKRPYQSLDIIKEDSEDKPKFLSLSISKSHNMICSHTTNGSCNKCTSDSQLNNKVEIIDDFWICECTFRNKIYQVNCSMCFKARSNQNATENVFKDESNNIEVSSNSYENETNNFIKFEEKRQYELYNETNDNENQWKCPKCTTLNNLNSFNCSTCYEENPNQINKYDQNANEKVLNHIKSLNSSLNETSNLFIAEEIKPLKLHSETNDNENQNNLKLFNCSGCENPNPINKHDQVNIKNTNKDATIIDIGNPKNDTILTKIFDRIFKCFLSFYRYFLCFIS